LSISLSLVAVLVAVSSVEEVAQEVTVPVSWVNLLVVVLRQSHFLLSLLV